MTPRHSSDTARTGATRDFEASHALTARYPRPANVPNYDDEDETRVPPAGRPLPAGAAQSSSHP